MTRLFTESGSAPVKSGDRWKAVLITPGMGSSGYYGEGMLAEYGPLAFPKGTHSYVDHPKEDGEVRSPKNLMGVLAEDAYFEDGVGLVAEIEVMPHWLEFVEAVAPHTGLSIYAMGEGKYEGDDLIVESLIPHVQNSVDLVSYPGRPGSKLADKLYEAAVSEYKKSKCPPGKVKRGGKCVDEALTEQLPDAYRPATSDDVPEGRACGNCKFFNESRLDEDGRAWCERWEAFAEGGGYCDAWEAKDSAEESGKRGTAANEAAATPNMKEGNSDMELKELSDQIAELPNLVAAAVAEALAPSEETDMKEEPTVEAVAEALIAAELPEVSRKAVYESVRAGGDLAAAIEAQKAFVESVKAHLKEEAPKAAPVEETVIVGTEESAPRLSEILKVKVGA